MTEKIKKPIPIPSTEKRGKVIPKKTITIVAKCDCVNEYQDKIYGKGMRAKNSTGIGLRCTVCGKKT